jgi:hypothetical protein
MKSNYQRIVIASFFCFSFLFAICLPMVRYPSQIESTSDTISYGLHQTSSQTVDWVYMWGDVESDYGYGIWGDSMDGIYTVGITWNYDNGKGDMVLVKWNVTTGLRLWNYTWGGSEEDTGMGIWGDATGGIYTVGSTWSFNASSADLLLVKWNATNGEILWNHTWGGSDEDVGNGIWGDTSGWIYTVGYTKSFDIGMGDIVLVKWNATTGVPLWNYTWGGSEADTGTGVWGDAIGGIYTVGTTSSFNASSADLVLVKWDGTTGTTLWNYTWGGSGEDNGLGVWGDAEYGIYTVGDTWSFGEGLDDLVLIKWDAITGNLLWNSSWGGIGEDSGAGVWGNLTEGIYTVGNTWSSGEGDNDILLIKWDAITGAQLSTRTWGGSDDDAGYGIWGDTTSGIYTVGETWSFDNESPDMVLIKWASESSSSIPGFTFVFLVFNMILLVLVISFKPRFPFKSSK